MYRLAIPRQTIPDASDLTIASGFDVNALTTADVVFAAIAFVSGFLLSRLAKRGIVRVLGRVDGFPADAARIIARVVGYVIVLLGTVVALEALGFSLGPLGGLLLVLIVIAALSAKPLLEDVGASMILHVRQPFTVGDQVMIDDHRGEVLQISARSVRILAADGRHVHLPNRWVLDQPIVNLTVEGRRLTSFVAGVDYTTDLDHARAVAVEAVASADGVLEDPAAEVLVDELADSTINLTCRFWHDPTFVSEIRARDAAIRAVKRAFDADGIVIAFPQRVQWQAGEP